MKYLVYKHTNKLNGKVYIGITCKKPNERWKNGKGYDYNTHFYNAIKKYGWNDGFEHEVLYTKLTKDKANEIEIELIKKYDSTNRQKGYNIADGGNNIIPSIGEKHFRSYAIVFGVKKYCNIREFAEYENVAYSTARAWFNGATKMPQKYIEGGIEYRGKVFIMQTGKASGSELPSSKKVFCDGKEYGSISIFSKENDLSYSKVRAWFQKGVCPQEWVDKGLSTEERVLLPSSKPHKIAVECEGVVYQTMTECAKHYNTRVECIFSALKIIEQGKTSRKWGKLGLKYV